MFEPPLFGQRRRAMTKQGCTLCSTNIRNCPLPQFRQLVTFETFNDQMRRLTLLDKLLRSPWLSLFRASYYRLRFRAHRDHRPKEPVLHLSRFTISEESLVAHALSSSSVMAFSNRAQKAPHLSWVYNWTFSEEGRSIRLVSRYLGDIIGVKQEEWN
jgi:hypothetical protein